MSELRNPLPELDDTEPRDFRTQFATDMFHVLQRFSAADTCLATNLDERVAMVPVTDTIVLRRADGQPVGFRLRSCAVVCNDLAKSAPEAHGHVEITELKPSDEFFAMIFESSVVDTEDPYADEEDLAWRPHILAVIKSGKSMVCDILDPESGRELSDVDIFEASAVFAKVEGAFLAEEIECELPEAAAQGSNSIYDATDALYDEEEDDSSTDEETLDPVQNQVTRYSPFNLSDFYVGGSCPQCVRNGQACVHTRSALQ